MSNIRSNTSSLVLITSIFSKGVKSSGWQMFFKIGALKNFAIFTEEQLCRSLNFNKVAGQACSFKACVRYFLINFYFSPNDSPSQTMKDVFHLI